MERHPLARRLLAGLEPDVTARVLEIPALTELRKACTELLRAGPGGRHRAPRHRSRPSSANGIVALMLSVLMSVTQLGQPGRRGLLPRRGGGLRGGADRRPTRHAASLTVRPDPPEPGAARRPSRATCLAGCFMTLTLTLNFWSVSTATLPATNGHGPPGRAVGAGAADHSNYRWIALSTVTLGTLMVFINQSIVLISLPDIFRGIGLNPLTPGNTGYMLWMLMGFMVVLAVLVVTLGRVGDMFGRVKIFNLGFAVFTAFSILLAVTWLTGHGGRHLADRHARRPGRRRAPCSSPTRRRSSPTPSRPTSAGSGSASTTWPRSPAPSSGSSSAACWRRSSGTSSS